MNEGLTGLEWHEGEYDRTFIFGWTIPLNDYFCKIFFFFSFNISGGFF